MKITNKLGLPQPFVDAVTREYTYTDKRYSATSIMKGDRELMLSRRHHDEIESDVADMIWLIFGNAVHSILENSQETDNQIKETKLEVDISDGYVLSGIQDLYDDDTGVVTDYKTGSVWKVIHEDWDDYRKQTLLYVWLLRQIGFTNARAGEIVLLLKDHSKNKAKVDSSYPQHSVYKKSFKFTEAEIEEIGNWIDERFEQIKVAEQLDDEDLPLCSPEERWATPTRYAVMKEGRKSAIKLYDDEIEAGMRAEELGAKHYVEVREGTDKKCADYCSCCEFCSYWKSKYAK